MEWVRGGGYGLGGLQICNDATVVAVYTFRSLMRASLLLPLCRIDFPMAAKLSLTSLSSNSKYVTSHNLNPCVARGCVSTVSFKSRNAKGVAIALSFSVFVAEYNINQCMRRREQTR